MGSVLVYQPGTWLTEEASEIFVFKKGGKEETVGEERGREERGKRKKKEDGKKE